MILVVDSGATKAHWKSCNGINIKTSGISPFYLNTAEIINIIKNEFSIYQSIRPSKIFFYAPGCKTNAEKVVVVTALKDCFPNSIIEVNHDLFAAARAIYGKTKGITAILGTGSSSGLFNGVNFTDRVSSLGIIMGDEGSGAYKGKLLIQHYFYRKMDMQLASAFEEAYPEVKNPDFIFNFYKSQTFSKNLGKYTLFLSEFKNHPLIQAIIKKSFSDFINAHLTNYASKKVGFVGSIAFYFKEELTEQLLKNGFELTKIIKAPIDDLIDFHAEQV